MTLAEAMGAWGRDPDRYGEARRIDDVGHYLELHVEQGPRLEADGTDIGVVTSIVGLVGYRARVMGRTNHAGTTPMRVRRDALAGAARMVLAIRDQARGREDASANVGVIRVAPGSSNVVPGVCELSIDLRAPSAAGVGELDEGCRAALGAIAEEEGLGLELAGDLPRAPAPMSGELVELIEGAAAIEGASAARMPSGAGHDAMVLAGRVPAGMLLVPSRGGVGHSPDEYRLAGAVRDGRAGAGAGGGRAGLVTSRRGRLGSRGDRRRRGHRWDLHRPDALRHRLGGRPRPQGPLDAGRARARHGGGADRALRPGRRGPGDVGGGLPRDDRRHERRAHVRGRDRGDDHESAASGTSSTSGATSAPSTTRSCRTSRGRPAPSCGGATARSSRGGSPRPGRRAGAARRGRGALGRRELREAGVEAVAVCLLFSYLNPEHERRAAAIVAEEMPDAFVTASADVSPQFREFERFTTACMNAFVGPLTGRYLERLAGSLGEAGVPGDLHVMMSNGGVASAAQAARRPVTLICSRAPPAGVLGGLWAGHLDGRSRLITFDVGGTSADIGIVTERGVIEAQARDTQVAGYPLLVPMVDVHTIGAGGGSIAHRDPGGAFRVGPRSAGATPARPPTGPAAPSPPSPTPTSCSAGSTRTASWAGRCGSTARPPRRPWARSRRASACPLLEAAEGIVTIANANMAGAIRSRTIQKGHDPREFTLVAFGGGGPLAAAEVADLLGAPEVLVPPFPGITAATGLLTSDLKYDQMRTVFMIQGAIDADRIDRELEGIAGELRRRLRDDGVADGDIQVTTALDCRYLGQGYELRVALPGAASARRRSRSSTACTARSTGTRSPTRSRSSTCASPRSGCVRRSSACRPRTARWTMP